MRKELFLRTPLPLKTGSTRARQRRNSAGFILTLELLLLLSIFGVVIIFAITLINQRFVQSVSDPFGRTVFIYDSTPPMGKSLLIGRAIGFNQYEAPLVIYRIPDPAKPVAALLGVRPANFTTRPSVFYDNAGCSGPTWMLDPNNPVSGVSGEVSDFYSVQGTAFAIGTDGVSQNVLYRSVPGAPPLVLPLSRWVSERYSLNYSLNCQVVVGPDPALQAALIPAIKVSDMSTIFLPPYWTPVQVSGTPLSAATAPKKEGDPWPP